ncbi:MBL fold metallo-hydrolase [Indiicoccus explosivorum]|uniref:MBL fold metallo-hydrolase n=1 Tax=Indiicoccus explosivorum TaxID=1917864 RepID=UPI000B43C13D|nr:MBL fold metallo-hydrolase [Indiicoccus explosivorum]
MQTIETLELGPVQTNCYILTHHDGSCVIIDPGAEAEKIIARIEENKRVPLAVLLTHAHFDHIGAVDAVRGRFGVPVYLSEHEKDWLGKPNLNGSGKYPMLPDLKVNGADFLISGSERNLELGPFRIDLFHTPGHSPGSITYVFREEALAVVGDTLFRGSIGRTDLAGGSHGTLLASIRDSLLTLPADMPLYPGHGPVTTAGAESRTNPFL